MGLTQQRVGTSVSLGLGQGLGKGLGLGLGLVPVLCMVDGINDLSGTTGLTQQEVGTSVSLGQSGSGSCPCIMHGGWHQRPVGHHGSDPAGGGQ